MLLTGTDHHIAGIGTMLEVASPEFRGAPGYEGYLNERVVALPELLRDAGYLTLMSGKWHLGATIETSPWARGFERSFALLPAGASHYGGADARGFSPVPTLYAEDDHFVTVGTRWWPFTTQGGIRVTGFVTWAGFARQQQIGAAFSTVMDIAPTLLELAGTAHPGTAYRGRAVAPMRGRSLVEYLTGTADTVHDAGTGTGWELFGRRAIRQGDWKALYLPAPYGPGDWQLYDLASDPSETEDLAGSHPDKLAELLALWDRYVDETGVILEPVSVYDAIR